MPWTEETDELQSMGVSGKTDMTAIKHQQNKPLGLQYFVTDSRALPSTPDQERKCPGTFQAQWRRSSALGLLVRPLQVDLHAI